MVRGHRCRGGSATSGGDSVQNDSSSMNGTLASENCSGNSLCGLCERAELYLLLPGLKIAQRHDGRVGREGRQIEESWKTRPQRTAQTEKSRMIGAGIKTRVGSVGGAPDKGRMSQGCSGGAAGGIKITLASSETTYSGGAAGN